MLEPLKVPRTEVAPLTGEVFPRTAVELVGVFAVVPPLLGAVPLPAVPPRAEGEKTKVSCTFS